MIRFGSDRRHPMRNTLKQLAFLSAIASVAATVRAAEAVGGRPDFQLALIKYAGGNWNPRPHGLTRLAWEIASARASP